ncbi:MAG: hypothetical protein WKH64_19215 [Chloroflexia bacterium]
MTQHNTEVTGGVGASGSAKAALTHVALATATKRVTATWHVVLRDEHGNVKEERHYTDIPLTGALPVAEEAD